MRRALICFVVMWTAVQSATLFAQPFLIACSGGHALQPGTDYTTCPSEDLFGLDVSNQVMIDLFLDDNYPYQMHRCTNSFSFPPADMVHCPGVDMSHNGSDLRNQDPGYFYATCTDPWSTDVDSVVICTGSMGSYQASDICNSSTTHDPVTCEYIGGSSSSSSSGGGGTYTGPTAEEVQNLFIDAATFLTFGLGILCFFIGFFTGTRQ